MGIYTSWVEQALAGLDSGHVVPDAVVPMEDKLIRVVAAAASLFQKLLKIHPYLNGNGHIARMCMVVLFRRYDVWVPVSFVEPSPEGADRQAMVSALEAHRAGNFEPLETWLMRRLNVPH